MEPVRTHRAKSVVEAARLHRARDRRERGLTLVEGPDLVADVIAAGAEVVEIFSIDPRPGTGDLAVDHRALERLAGTKSPRGPVAVVQIPTEWLDRERNLLVSAGVSDPGNVGTMIRTAAAFGWGFAYADGSADPWSPKTIRAGGGGQFQTPVARIGSIAALGEWATVATVVTGGEPLRSVDRRPVALLIGEEAHGLDDTIADAADYRVTIPTPGPTESLNAAVAAAIAIYELSDGSGEDVAGV
ncbi:MAG TPA: RNA methyltransferase [Acidimicrobiia bacterium]|nr:RNA methyltransferase [Acidimicrobiia bacterium]